MISQIGSVDKKYVFTGSPVKLAWTKPKLSIADAGSRTLNGPSLGGDGIIPTCTFGSGAVCIQLP